MHQIFRENSSSIRPAVDSGDRSTDSADKSESSDRAQISRLRLPVSSHHSVKISAQSYPPVQEVRVCVEEEEEEIERKKKKQESAIKAYNLPAVGASRRGRDDYLFNSL